MDLAKERAFLREIESKKIAEMQDEARTRLVGFVGDPLPLKMKFRREEAIIWSGLTQSRLWFNQASCYTIISQWLGIGGGGSRYLQFGENQDTNRKLLILSLSDIAQYGGDDWSEPAKVRAKEFHPGALVPRSLQA